MTETFTAVAETAVLRETIHAAAELLVQQLPTVARLTPVVVQPAPEPPVDAWLVEHAVVGTFVGAASYRFAITVRPELLPTAGDGDAVTIDYMRTALSDAMSCFGNGVLAGLRVDDARSLFAHDDAAIARLDDNDAPAGAFAVVQTSRPSKGGVLDRIGRISGVEMDLTVQIGRTRLAVRDVLGLEAGSIVELDRSAGAPADILLNGRLIAHGEVVVVDQDYAVRITSIVDAANQAL